MHREALEAKRRVLGHEHQDTLASMNNLANVLQEQGQWQESEEMHREALEAKRRVLGQEHPDTLASMTNLANVLREQGKWKEADEMHREALEAKRRVLGLEHPDTLASMSCLAIVLRHKDQWQEAEQMHREALEAKRKVLGQEHPDTLASMTCLAIVLRHKDQWQEAEQMHREALEAKRKVLGQEHPRTLNSMNNLANVLRDQGKWQEAEEMHREVLELMCRVLGPAHPWTWDCMSDTAQVLVMRDRDDWTNRFQHHLDKDLHQDRFNMAVSYWRSAIAAFQKASKTEDHPDLLSYREYLAKVLVQANRESTLLEAEGLLQLIIPALSKRFGVEDARTQRAIATLVSLLEEQGRDEDAEQWRQHLLQTQDDGDDVRALPTENIDLDIPEEVQENSYKLASLLRQFPGLEYGLERYVLIASSKSGTTLSGPNEVHEEARNTALSSDASQLSAGQGGNSCAWYSLESFDSSHASTAFLQAALPVVQRRMRREQEGRGGT